MFKYLFLLLCYLKIISGVIYKLSDEEYDLMPPICQLDPFEPCMKEPGAVYCTTYGSYVTDQPSRLLRMMQEYSEHEITHFNHTRALHGVCLTKSCNHLYKSANKKDLKATLEACLNETIWKKYELKVVTEELSCTIENDNKIEITSSFIVVAGICLSIVLLNIIGTIYDVRVDKNKDGTVSQLLLCFSIPRNWRILNAPPATIGDPRLQNLKAIHGIRAISMVLVILAHTLLPSLLLTSNPKFVETVYQLPVIQLILNGTPVMQTFLIISAFLLVYNLQLLSEKQQIGWSLMPMAIIKRWLRLTPSYALVLALTATWLRYCGSGPVWDNIVTIESRACETEWWSHILYINNYIDGSLCMPQTWYLAADTQLYCMGIMIYIICRNSEKRKMVLSILFLIGLIIPAIHTYVQDLDGTLLVSPSSAQAFFTTDRTFNNVYKRGHANLAGYVMGLSLGYLVYHLQNNKFDVTKYRCFRFLFWLTFPFSMNLIYTGRMFYEDAPRADMLTRLVVSILMKPVFGFLMAIILFGVIMKYENLYRGILEWSGWTTLSRTSYSAYLLHVAFIRGLSGLQQQELPGDYVRLTEFLICVMTVTYFTGYIFWLTVESPLGQLVKLCVDGPLKKTMKQEKTDKCNDNKT